MYLTLRPGRPHRRRENNQRKSGPTVLPVATSFYANGIQRDVRIPQAKPLGGGQTIRGLAAR